MGASTNEQCGDVWFVCLVFHFFRPRPQEASTGRKPFFPVRLQNGSVGLENVPGTSVDTAVGGRWATFQFEDSW